MTSLICKVKGHDPCADKWDEKRCITFLDDEVPLVRRSSKTLEFNRGYFNNFSFEFGKSMTEETFKGL